MLELRNFYCFVVTTLTATARLRSGFSHGSKPPAGATRVSVFFAGFIAKITLTLLADSERLPFNFRAGATKFLLLRRDDIDSAIAVWFFSR
jgi:hydrogenase/urease accessory protein HupE